MRIKLTSATTGKPVSVDVRKIYRYTDNMEGFSLDNDTSTIEVKTDRGIKTIEVKECFFEFLELFYSAKKKEDGDGVFERSDIKLIDWAWKRIYNANESAGIELDWYNEQKIDYVLCQIVVNKGQQALRYFVYNYCSKPTGMEAFDSYEK